jgi:hypothetical protein
MIKVKLAIISIALLLLLAPNCAAEILQMKLDQMIKYADFIIVGKVLHKDGYIANIVVHQILKGSKKLRNLSISLKPMATCDTSNIAENEIVLLFLNVNSELTKSKKKIKDFNSDSDNLLITNYGQGKMIIHQINGVNYFYIYYPDVTPILYPKNIKIKKNEFLDEPNIGLMKVDDLVSYINHRSH